MTSRISHTTIDCEDAYALSNWWKKVLKYVDDPDDPNHTFFFHIDDKHVIDGNDGGNAAKWINHACGPNCEADETDDGRVFIKALRDIEPMAWDFVMAFARDNNLVLVEPDPARGPSPTSS